MAFPDALDPVTVRRNLLLASLYLSGFELLADSLIDRIRSFFTFGDALGDERYRAELDLGGHSTLENSCLWLVVAEALTPEEAEEINSIRRRRNRVAHELTAILVGEQDAVNVADLARLRDLLGKIEVWWILNVELPTNPGYDPDALPTAGDIRTGYTLLFDYLLEQATEV